MKSQAFATMAAAVFLPFGAVPAQSKASPDTAATIAKVVRASERKDCRTVQKVGAPLLDGAAAGAAEASLATLYERVAACELGSGAINRAYGHALRGTAREGATDKLWRLRLSIENGAGRLAAAVSTVEAMAGHRPAALNGCSSGSIWQLRDAVKRSGDKALLRRLLAVLAGDDYRPDDYHGVAPDSHRVAYARLLAEAGDTEAARRVVARLETAGGIAAALLDPTLRGGLPRDADVRQAAERSLERHRQWAMAHPDSLGALIDAAADLRALGRPDEALALLDTARARIGDAKAFEDRDEQLIWWWNALAKSHRMLGHYEEAVGAYRIGIHVPERDLPGVSLVINLAQAQLAFGRPEEALQTLAVFEQPNRRPNGYGAMQMRWPRACAQTRLGHADKAAGDVAYLLANEKDAPQAVSDFYLCSGDLDGAAASFVRRLADPDLRVEALLDLSDYDPPPVRFAGDPAASRYPALKARADVKAAIAKAGGVRRFAVQRGEI